MRQARCTWDGAFHHCTNRGHGGDAILAGNEAKRAFLDLVGENAKKYRMRIFSYCLMDNHYHMVLENASGRMSQFFRFLNSQYASWYRKRFGGRGYVFQDRFYSALIQDTEYLKLAILYVLRNPVQAGIAKAYRAYPWSNGKQLFVGESPCWLDSQFVEKLFDSRAKLDELVKFGMATALPIIRSPSGPVLGDAGFVSKLKRMAGQSGKRRKGPGRHQDMQYIFLPVRKVIRDFEMEKKVAIPSMRNHTLAEKRLRAELLVRLRERAGLPFPQIARLTPFQELSCSALPHIYKNACQRLAKQIHE